MTGGGGDNWVVGGGLGADEAVLQDPALEGPLPCCKPIYMPGGSGTSASGTGRQSSCGLSAGLRLHGACFRADAVATMYPADNAKAFEAWPDQDVFITPHRMRPDDTCKTRLWSTPGRNGTGLS